MGWWAAAVWTQGWGANVRNLTWNLPMCPSSQCSHFRNLPQTSRQTEAPPSVAISPANISTFIFWCLHSIPGIVQGLCRCGPWTRVSWDGLMVGLDDIRGLSQPLQFCTSKISKQWLSCLETLKISVLITCDFSYQITRTMHPQESTPVLGNLLCCACLPHHLVNNLLRKWLAQNTSSRFWKLCLSNFTMKLFSHLCSAGWGS